MLLKPDALPTPEQLRQVNEMFAQLMCRAILNGAEPDISPEVDLTERPVHAFSPPQPTIETIPREPQVAAPIPVWTRERERRRAFRDEVAERRFNTKPRVGHFTLTDLTQSVCHYPVNDDAPYLFCGRSLNKHERSYCRDHHRLCYRRSA